MTPSSHRHSRVVSSGARLVRSHVLWGVLGPNLKAIPVLYRDLEVFSKSLAVQLPPRQPCDMVIDLLAGMVPPRGWLYSLSAGEQNALEDYVLEGLQRGTIRPSSSPSSLFRKKTGASADVLIIGG